MVAWCRFLDIEFIGDEGTGLTIYGIFQNIFLHVQFYWNCIYEEWYMLDSLIV